MKYLYYYIYRIRLGGTVYWDNPTGGMYIPAEDQPHLRDVGYQRYHCSPYERLIFVEVLDRNETWYVWLYHKLWEQEMRDFKELMESEYPTRKD